MCCILGVEQRIRHLTTAQVRTIFEIETSMKDLLSVKRLCWLSQTARMSDDIPKKLLFGWLPQTQPAHGETK